MGDIADMMLDGTLCEGCGVYLPGEGEGIPRYCRDCFPEAVVRHVALLREQQSMIDALVSNYELRNEMARVTSERDSLRRDLDAVNAAHDRLLTEHIAVTDERNQLRRDLEAARDYIEALDMQNHRLRCDAETDLRDADRYRWLRGDLCEDHSHRWTQWEVRWWTQWEVRCWKAPMWTDDLRREDLDAAIDLARARGEGNDDE